MNQIHKWNNCHASRNSINNLKIQLIIVVKISFSKIMDFWFNFDLFDFYFVTTLYSTCNRSNFRSWIQLNYSNNFHWFILVSSLLFTLMNFATARLIWTWTRNFREYFLNMIFTFALTFSFHLLFTNVRTWNL